MHDVRAAQMRKHRKCERIISIPAHLPWIADHANLEVPDTFTPFSRTEREQHRLDFVGHMAREFVSVTFAAAKDPVCTKNRGYNVQNSQDAGLRANACALVTPRGTGNSANVGVVLPAIAD